MKCPLLLAVIFKRLLSGFVLCCLQSSVFIFVVEKVKSTTILCEVWLYTMADFARYTEIWRLDMAVNCHNAV